MRLTVKQRRMIKAHKDTEVLEDDGVKWYSPRAAAAELDVTTATLRNWKTTCPWLEKGKGLKTKRLRGGNRRFATYYRKDDLGKVSEARADRELIPELQGLVYTRDAAAQLGCHPGTLRRWMKKKGKKFKRVTGKSADGLPRRRYYVSAEVIEDLNREKRGDPKPTDKVTLREAAELIGGTYEGVRAWVRRGQLKRYDGKKASGRGPRRCVLISRADLLAKVNGQPPTDAPNCNAPAARTTPVPARRLVIEPASLSITLDGVTFDGLDPFAFRIFEAIAAGGGTPVPTRHLHTLPGLHSKLIQRELKKLPPELRSILRGKTGSGRWIELPRLGAGMATCS